MILCGHFEFYTCIKEMYIHFHELCRMSPTFFDSSLPTGQSNIVYLLNILYQIQTKIITACFNFWCIHKEVHGKARSQRMGNRSPGSIEILHFFKHK